ncbi:MAG: aldo/keto reductase [Rhodospirillales bacterium]
MDSHRPPHPTPITRRAALTVAAAVAATALLPRRLTAVPAETSHVRPIPFSGELLPAIGLGTWITFNVGDDPLLRAERAEVLRAFFDEGGNLVDSSPMYGSSEAVVGYGLKHIPGPVNLFSATKVWAPFGARAEGQMAESRRLWGLDRFDLMQVHNLLNWKGLLPKLLEDRDAGLCRYVGVTTSHGRRHDEMAEVMAAQPIQFVQFSYNIVDRGVERRLLPMAADRGLAVIINRPFRTKELFSLVGQRPLPDFAAEIDCANWAQFFLKFVISHPAVTCAIPATSRISHLRQNMGALWGPLPDAEMRARMVRYMDSL